MKVKNFIRLDSTDFLDASEPLAFRFDVGRASLSGARTTPQGFLAIPATLTRAGVLEYTRADGTVVRELRPPEEVFKADSLASLKTAPVTEYHPPEQFVSPKNIQKVSVGVVPDIPTQKGELVDGEVIIQRADSIAKVNAKELVELSPGYSCSVENTPGVYNGQPYDRVQRNIKYNHVALLPANKGRSGNDVRLRFDDIFTPVEASNKQPKEIAMKKIKIRLDGVEYEIEVPEALAAHILASAEKLEQSRNDAQTALVERDGKLEELKGQIKVLTERLDAAEDPKAIEAKAQERAAVVEKATKFVAEARFDGLTVGEIKRQALAAKKVDTKNATDDFVNGAFTMLEEPKRLDSTVKPPSAKPNAETKNDAQDKTWRDSREEMIQRGLNAYKTFE